MEYGGELFGLRSNRPYLGEAAPLPADWALFRSGRDALRAFARLAGRKRVLMPALCCASMILPFQQNGYEPVFYRLRPDYSADADDVCTKLRPGDVLLYMRYFGIRPFEDEFLAALRRRADGILFLEDRTHDILVPRAEGGFQPDAAAASLRKWAALPEGGMLRTRLGTCKALTDSRYGELRLDAMEKKSRYLQSFDPALGLEAREESARAERLLDEGAEPVKMSPRSAAMLGQLDFAKILAARQRNLCRLRARLEPVIADGSVRLMTERPENSGLYLPVLIEDRDRVQQALIRRKIYCPAAIWPEPPEARGVCPVSRHVTEHMLSVLCDQRYTEDEMDYIADNLMEILREKKE